MAASFLAFCALARPLVSALADTLSPPACGACDAPLAERAIFCAPCAASVVRAGSPLEAGGDSALCPVIAAGSFGGALSVALRRFKYEDRPDLGVPLGHLLRRTVREVHLTGEVVVPVPLHPRRLADRGYNQAALLAAEVATELAAPLVARALVRERDTRQQALLDREARLRNVAEAFRVRTPEAIRERRVVLIDDVATTGATLRASAAALLRAGARQVTALVVARTEGGLGGSAVAAPPASSSA